MTLEAVRFMGKGYECRVSLGDGTSDQAIITVDEEGRERQCFSPDDAEEGREHRASSVRLGAMLVLCAPTPPAAAVVLCHRFRRARKGAHSELRPQPG